MKPIEQAFSVAHQEFLSRKAKEDQTKETIKTLVGLVDALRQPYNNSKRHDLYLMATAKLNELEDEGRI
jgi:hypothetical protein